MYFFSDAIVAIAITLLAFGLKIEKTEDGHLHFSDLLRTWHQFLTFALSFLNIAVFWKIHHQFFQYIKKINSTILWYNIAWLLFIATLPFTASLVSSFFHDTPAILLYCLNILFLTFFQNQIWDYVAVRPTFLKDELDPQTNYSYRLSFNVAMINALLACILSFFSSLAAFIVLFMRFPAIAVTRRIFHQRLSSHTAES